METTVIIKNGQETITSLNNLNRVVCLNTKNNYLTDNITIELQNINATASAADLLSSKVAYVDGTQITGAMAEKTASDITHSSNIVTVPSGYYSVSATHSIPTTSLSTDIISGAAFEEASGDYAWKSTVQIPEGYHTSQTLEKIFSSILPAPTTEGTSSDLRLGKQLYDHDGKLITGIMTEKEA